MNFSKTDEDFDRASVDEVVRKVLLQKMKKFRKLLVWIFWGNVTFLAATALFCFWQMGPLLNGNFGSSNPTMSIGPGFAFGAFGAIGFSTVLGLLSVFGLVAADLRVKMLIMVGSLEQRMPHKSQEAEQDVHGNTH